ncbi:MAG: hypothetical protein WC860_03400, partial [Candidatus Margulisiibacteriota bacterium]
ASSRGLPARLSIELPSSSSAPGASPPGASPTQRLQRAGFQTSTGQIQVDLELLERLGLPKNFTIIPVSNSLLANLVSSLDDLAKPPRPESFFTLPPLLESSSAKNEELVPIPSFSVTGAQLEDLCPAPAVLPQMELTDNSVKLLFAEHLLLSLTAFYTERTKKIPSNTSGRKELLINLHHEFMTKQLPKIEAFFHEKFAAQYDTRLLERIREPIIKKITNHFFMDKFFKLILFTELSNAITTRAGKAKEELRIEDKIVFFGFNRIATANTNFLVASDESDVDFNGAYKDELIRDLLHKTAEDQISRSESNQARSFLQVKFIEIFEKNEGLIKDLGLKLEINPHFTFLSIGDAKKLRASKSGGLFYSALPGEYQVMCGNALIVKMILGEEIDLEKLSSTPAGKLKIIELIRKLMDLYYTELANKESFKKVQQGHSQIRGKLDKIKHEIEIAGAQGFFIDLLPLLNTEHLVGFNGFGGKVRSRDFVNNFLVNTKTNFCRIGDMFLHGFISVLSKSLYQENFPGVVEFRTLIQQLTTKRGTISIAQALTNIGVMLQDISIKDILSKKVNPKSLPDLLDSLYSYTSCAQICADPETNLKIIDQIVTDAFQSNLLADETVSIEDLRFLGLSSDEITSIQSLPMIRPGESPIHTRRKSSFDAHSLSKLDLAHLREKAAIPEEEDDDDEVNESKASTSGSQISEKEVQEHAPELSVSLSQVITFLMKQAKDNSYRSEERPSFLACVSYLLVTRLTKVASEFTEQFIKSLGEYEKFLNDEIHRSGRSVTAVASSSIAEPSLETPLVSMAPSSSGIRTMARPTRALLSSSSAMAPQEAVLQPVRYVRISGTFITHANRIGRIVPRHGIDEAQQRYRVVFSDGSQCFPPFNQVIDLNEEEIKQAVASFSKK